MSSIKQVIENMAELELFESQYELSEFWFGRGKSYVSSMKCRNRRISTEALLHLSRRLTEMAGTFEKSQIGSMRDRAEPMVIFASEIEKEIDLRLLS